MRDAMNTAIELTERVLLLMREERWLDAIKALKCQSSIVDRDWRLSWNLGWCYFKLERFEAARKYLTQANMLSKHNAVCLWGLGSVYLAKKQFRQAEKNLVRALEIRDLHIARISLALTYLQQGKLDEAERVHVEGIGLKPKASCRYESYGCFLEDVGRVSEAEKMYLKVKQLRKLT